MEIKFSKYHGLGNDFIIIDYINDQFDYSKLVKSICERYIGLGADGLIVVIREPLTMIYYNQDGSLGTMCGNGLRCFCKYVTDKKYINDNDFSVLTSSGIYKVQMREDLVNVEFLEISLDPKRMGIDTEKDKFFNEVVLDSTCYAIHSGTSHLVVFVDDFKQITGDYAKSLHEYPLFTEKINVNFVKVKSRNELIIKTYERGVGYTLACGTGAIASFKICRMLDKVNSRITVEYKVGKLLIEETGGKISFTGPAIKIANGVYIYD